MRGALAALEVMAWIGRNCSGPACRSYEATSIVPSWDSLTFSLSRSPLLHASSSTSPSGGVPDTADVEEKPPRHLKDTPASQELRLLVSNLREEEALRRRMRRKGKSQGGGFVAETFDGLLPVFKPSGITSADACRVLRHLLRSAEAPLFPQLSDCVNAPLGSVGQGAAVECGVGLTETELTSPKRKLRVGHGGTLDPAASGTRKFGIVWWLRARVRLPVLKTKMWSELGTNPPCSRGLLHLLGCNTPCPLFRGAPCGNRPWNCGFAIFPQWYVELRVPRQAL